MKNPKRTNAYRASVLGLKRLELWLSPQALDRLDEVMSALETESRADTIRYAIDIAHDLEVKRQKKYKLRLTSLLK